MIAEGAGGGAPPSGWSVRPGRRAVLLAGLLVTGCGAPPVGVARPTRAAGSPPVRPAPAPTSLPSEPAPPGPPPGAAADAGPSVDPPLPAEGEPSADQAPPASGGPTAADREAGVLPGVLPDAGAGTTRVVPGSTAGSGVGQRRRVRVEVEDGLPVDGAAFAAFVMATLTDPRGWSREGWDFVRTDGEADTVLTLATAQTSARMCAPLVTNGTLSCRVGGDVVLTAVRWLQGADAYGKDRTGYRRYVVSHEFGHSIGKGHVGCPAPGTPAPTMMQQSIGVGACAAQPWPYP